jgi:IS5 family transposase
LPVEFEITGGEVNDCSAAPDLIASLPDAEVVVADKDYDSEYIREQIYEEGSQGCYLKKMRFGKG